METIYRALKEYTIAVRGNRSEMVDAVGQRTSRPIRHSREMRTINSVIAAELVTDNETLAAWYDETGGVDFDDLPIGSLVAYDVTH